MTLVVPKKRSQDPVGDKQYLPPAAAQGKLRAFSAHMTQPGPQVSLQLSLLLRKSSREHPSQCTAHECGFATGWKAGSQGAGERACTVSQDSLSQLSRVMWCNYCQTLCQKESAVLQGRECPSLPTKLDLSYILPTVSLSSCEVIGSACSACAS